MVNIGCLPGGNWKSFLVSLLFMPTADIMYVTIPTIPLLFVDTYALR